MIWSHADAIIIGHVREKFNYRIACVLRDCAVQITQAGTERNESISIDKH